MSAVCNEKGRCRYMKLWDDGEFPTCKTSKIFFLRFKTGLNFRGKRAKQSKDLEVVEIVGRSGRRHAICREIEKRVFIETESNGAPEKSLHKRHFQMVKAYRLACYELI